MNKVVKEEPEKIKKWREEQKKRLEEKGKIFIYRVSKDNFKQIILAIIHLISSNKFLCCFKPGIPLTRYTFVKLSFVIYDILYAIFVVTINMDIFVRLKF